MTIDQRIGAFIGYKRRRLHRISQLSKYTQKEFIKATREVSLYGCSDGVPVCSRTTLVKIENGFKSQETQVLDFFLRKLNCHHRIMDDELSKTDQILNKYLKNHSLKEIDSWIKNFNQEIKDFNQQLLTFDYYALIMMKRYYESSKNFSIHSILHLLEILKVINENLFYTAIEIICFEIYFHKEYWFYSNQVIERFRVLNVETEISLWFTQVFQFRQLKELIPFPSHSNHLKFNEQIKKYKWYCQQPLFSYDKKYLLFYKVFLRRLGGIEMTIVPVISMQSKTGKLSF